MIMVNLGCGTSPIPGFLNFDNSLSVKLASHFLLSKILFKFGLLDSSQMSFIKFCKVNDIKWADATTCIPLSSNSVSVLYSSHMLEHLDKHEAKLFLSEATRVLCPGGLIRLALPDLSKLIDHYNVHKDANKFLDLTLLCHPNPKGFFEKIRTVILGNRHHLWMYDGRSLADLLMMNGFVDAQIMPSGQTNIKDYGFLDLNEREDESVYVEAFKPWE